MSRRILLLSMLVAALMVGSAYADCLILRNGKRIDTSGPWVTRGNIVTVHDTTGRAETLTLSVIDFDASLKANLHNPRSTPDQVHVDGDTIEMLRSLARNQVELSRRIREQEQANLLAQMTGSKPSAINARGGPKSPGAMPFGSESKPGKGFESTQRCAIWQDNLPLYNACLNQTGH